MRKLLIFVLYITSIMSARADVLYELVETKCARDLVYFSWRSVRAFNAFKLEAMTEDLAKEWMAVGEEAKLNQYGFFLDPETTCEIGRTQWDKRKIEIRDITPGGWEDQHPNAVDMELVVDGTPILKMKAIWGIPYRDNQHFLEIWGRTVIHCVQSFGKDQEQPYIAATSKPLEFTSHTQRCRRFRLPSRWPGVE